MAKKQRLKNQPPRSRGRPKGVPNKVNGLLKDAILKAATDAGDGDLSAYLRKQATEVPGPFLALLGKILPLQIAGAAGTAAGVLFMTTYERPTED